MEQKNQLTEEQLNTLKEELAGVRGCDLEESVAGL